MAPRSEKPISLKFVLFVAVIFVGLFFYVTAPDDMKKIKKTQTFEEMLEYNKAPKEQSIEDEEFRAIQNQKALQAKRKAAQNAAAKKQKTVAKDSVEQKDNTHHMFTTNTQKQQETAYTGINTYDEKFNNLLQSLEQYPPKNLASVETIVNKILVYKGYQPYTLKIETDEKDELKSQTQGSYVAATFNFQTGNIHINKVALYSLRIQDIVAILAHEIDHFDKIAKVCKSMGADNFIKLLNDNKMKDVNTSFWQRAPLRTNINGFDSQYYKDALVRFLSQGDMDLASTYADLYRLSEYMRNPLELSAYEVSDYIYDFYGIKKYEGPLQKLISKFNSVDWAIYNLVAKDNILSNQRIALFDYFFMQAILTKHSKYRKVYEQCLNNDNGDMTKFWIAFETDNKTLYSKYSQIDKETYANIMSLLELTEQKTKTGLTENVVENALKYKVNTLLNNIVFPNAVKNIKTAASDYIQYAKKANTKNPKDELKMILTLICIENELTKNKTLKLPSLYYIKIPDVLMNAYKVTNDNKKFHFIYNNEAFKEEFTTRKASQPSLTEQTLLSDLIYENRLFIKI